MAAMFVVSALQFMGRVNSPQEVLLRPVHQLPRRDRPPPPQKVGVVMEIATTCFALWGMIELLERCNCFDLRGDSFILSQRQLLHRQGHLRDLA